MQQKISTPSVIEILDTKIRSSQAYSYPEVGGIAPLDPWNTVLSQLEPYALEPETFVAALRSALTGPNATNPFVTVAKYENRLEMRAFKLIGPVGSEADFEGSSLETFQDAMASLPSEGGWLIVLPGTYTFSGSLSLSSNVRLMGVHPETTVLKTSGNFTLLSCGANSRVERLLLDGTAIQDQPVVVLAGEHSAVERCSLRSINRLGASLVGARSRILWSKFSSSSTLSTTIGAAFQGIQQTIECCSFDGEFQGSGVQFESRESTLSKNIFSSALSGPAYKIASISLTDNKIVFNHFASQTSLSQAIDIGTSTLRYGNTPNTLGSNLNNALEPLRSLTGQPTLTSNQMVLSNSFTHDPSILKNAASLWGNIDLFTQKFYEERNFFLTSDDPIFDSEGRPSSGVFSWDGATNTLTWPSFTIRSLYGGRVVQTYTSGSMAVPPGFACVASLEDTSTIQKISVKLPLTDPPDSDQLVLLRTLSSGRATWLHHRHLFPGSVTTTFDVHGRLLPVSRFVGVTDPQNPTAPYDGFASCKQANITNKISDQTSLLQMAYEQTNLQFQPESPDSRITTDPAPGSWYDSSALLNGIATAPTHLLNVQGTLYGLLTTGLSGLYYFDRPAKGWRLVTGNPALGPFSSMSRIGTGVALLQTSGGIVIYNPKTGWSFGTSLIKDSVSLPFATTASSSSSYYEAGQADFSMQTSNYSLFSTLDGKTIRYYQDEQYMDAIPRVFTEAAGDKGLISYHPKDTGYNVRLDLETLAMDGENGGFLKRTGLPLSKFFSGDIIIPPRADREALLRLDWSAFKVENFAFCQPTGNFMLVLHDAAKTTFYLLIGGPGIIRLAAVLNQTYFNNDFTPHSWVLNPYAQTVYILGVSTTNSLIAYHGAWLPSTNSGGWGAGDFTFLRKTVTTSSCSGVIANLDLYNDIMGTRDVIALACDSSRSNRPTWWRYSVTNDTWTSKTFTDQVPSLATDVQLTWATANSFQYNFATDNAVGHGTASPLGFQFLVRSAARSGMPVLFRWLRASNSFEAQGLGAPDGVTLAGAETSGFTQSLGAVYHPTFKAVMWLSLGAANQVKLYTLFESATPTPTTWNISVIGSGGTYLSTTPMGSLSVVSRTGSMLGRTFGDAYVGASTVTEDVFFWSPSQGLIRGVLSGSIGGFDSQTWTVFTKRVFADQAVFSNTPTNCYHPLAGVDRAGELSLQLTSFAEPDLPVHGASSFGPCADYEGVAWNDTGTLVKNLGLPYVWAGVSRGGYLWIANARGPNNQSRQVEYTYGPAVRGDVTFTGLIATPDFSWAMTPDQSSIAIVYRTSGAPNYFVFVLYDVASNTITTVERPGVTFTGSYVVSLAAVTPQITYNQVIGSWDIVASENTRLGGQLVFYRRLANQPDSTLAWSGERVGSGGDAPLDSMVAQAGILPDKPLVLADGSLLIATESSGGNVHLVKRDTTGTWSLVYLSTLGGFNTPRLTRTQGYYWIVGATSTLGQAGILRSQDGLTNWTYLVTPNTSQTTACSNYCRVRSEPSGRYPVVYAMTDKIIIASPLIAETGTTNNQEMGVFTVAEDGTITGSAFASKSRLGSLSGQEETSFDNLSWTYKGDLLYSAARPSKSVRHWTIVRSMNAWQSTGESVVGPGRLISIGEKQYREDFVSINQSETKIITEYPSLAKHSLLPLATRKVGELFGLRWQALSYTGSLFGVWDGSAVTMDGSLPSGTLAAVGSRRWPRISGNTQGILSGASVFGYGAGLRISAPAGLTSASYFGATLPTSGLFRVEALAALNFIGTHTLRASDSSRSYSITGPLTFLLTTKDQNLVLEFSLPETLVLDPLATGLSYWLEQEHPTEKYAIVLGQNKDTGFLLSSLLGGQLLYHGTYEPKELTAFDVRFENRLPLSFVPAFNYHFEQIPTSIAKSFKFKIEGTNHGIQTINTSATSISQLVVMGPLALGFSFIDLVTDRLRASATILHPVLSAHTSGDVIVLGE